MKKIAVFLMALMLSLVLSMGTASAWFWGKKERTVDCTKGQNPQDVLDRAIGSRPLILYLIGPCSYDLEISRDDVTVVGGELLDDDDEEENGENNAIDANGGNGEEDACTSRATITGSIYLENVNRVALECLRVTGPGAGVVAYSSNVTIEASHIDDNVGIGVTASSASNVDIVESHIDHNGGNGVVAYSSNVTIEGSHIDDNVDVGLHLNWNSSAYVVDSDIKINKGFGILMMAGSSIELQDTRVDSNIGVGISLERNSNAGISGTSTIKDNTDNGIWIDSHSFVQIYNATIQNNGGPVIPEIHLFRDAGLHVGGTTSVDGDLDGSAAIICGDHESSVTIDESPPVPPPGPTVTPRTHCTGYNVPAP